MIPEGEFQELAETDTTFSNAAIRAIVVAVIAGTTLGLLAKWLI